ncbi:MAG: hypothetical protein AB9834_23525 [Lentimicrobium sp.]
MINEIKKSEVGSQIPIAIGTEVRVRDMKVTESRRDGETNRLQDGETERLRDIEVNIEREGERERGREGGT